MTGVFTGSYAIHPLTNERIPIWIADFVLDEYGSGAIMGVPAHDEADLIFAQQMGLPIHVVIQPIQSDSSISNENDQTGAFEQPGLLINSGAYSGLTSAQAQSAISAWIEANGLGKRTIKYRLRDWLISRQRYWGPPIPIIYCPDHGAVPVPEDRLPVLLPDINDWMPTGTGVSPLAAIDSFVNTTCPICGRPARRETDVSDNFLDSSWYFLRYPSNNDRRALGCQSHSQMAPCRYVYRWCRTQRLAPHVRTLHYHGATRSGSPGFLRAIQTLPSQRYHH